MVPHWIETCPADRYPGQFDDRGADGEDRTEAVANDSELVAVADLVLELAVGTGDVDVVEAGELGTFGSAGARPVQTGSLQRPQQELARSFSPVVECISRMCGVLRGAYC